MSHSRPVERYKPYIKPEPHDSSEDYRTNRDHRRSYKSSTDKRYSHFSSRDRSSDTRERRRDDVDSQRRGRRLHSPVIIKSEPDDRKFDKPRTDVDDRRRANKSKSPSPVKKETANFSLSGKLAEDTNLHNGIVVKYSEPPDARKPTEHWRLYAFKGSETLPKMHIHRQSGFLIGRDRKVADIPMDHPSISKQHAVLQYRHVKGLTRLYLIDLESANGTYLNHNRIESKRYYELLQKDVIKFGFSSREYVVMKPDTVDSDDNEEEDGDDAT